VKELQILTPDGKTTVVPLDGDRLTLGRSSAGVLCFPDDAGLSRQHLTLQRAGEEWTVEDLGSKNGTMVNGARLTSRHTLRSGDRIAAGHLVLVYDQPGGAPSTTPPGNVVFYEGEAEAPTTSTVMTSLEGVLAAEAAGKEAAVAGALRVSALIRAGQELAGHRPLNELFRFILDLSIEAVGAQRGVLMTLEGDRLVVRSAKGDGFRISSAVRDRVLNEKTSVLVQDATQDDAFRARLSIVEQKVRTLMAVPLQTKDRIIGLIYVDSPFFIKRFTKEDLNLLTVMANVAAIRIEHARLAEVEQAERILARDLDQAAEIQRRHLPALAPSVPCLDLAGYNAPCRTVGGDYYDFFTYPNSRVAMVLADVSGKGMPASLMMMSLQARVQVLVEEPRDLGEVMSRLNRLTAANCPSNRFITLFLCVLDPSNGELAYCNAGHNPPLVLRQTGEADRLEGGGPILGILPIARYEEHRCSLQAGDILVVYSDGVTEAANPADEEFGEERLAACLARRAGEPAESIIAAVNQELADWVAGAPAADDVTLIVARIVTGCLNSDKSAVRCPE
jgi:sigma-B regulation protein RsbU (phosphoserine phosphatase)